MRLELLRLRRPLHPLPLRAFVKRREVVQRRQAFLTQRRERLEQVRRVFDRREARRQISGRHIHGARRSLVRPRGGETGRGGKFRLEVLGRGSVLGGRGSVLGRGRRSVPRGQVFGHPGLSGRVHFCVLSARGLDFPGTWLWRPSAVGVEARP